MNPLRMITDSEMNARVDMWHLLDGGEMMRIPNFSIRMRLEMIGRVLVWRRLSRP